MKFQNYCICVLFTIFYLIQTGLTIKCWACRSDVDPNCGDPFDNSTLPLIDCSRQGNFSRFSGVVPKMCRKITQKVAGEWRYIRNCAYLEESEVKGGEQSCLKSTTSNILIEDCTCSSKDGCNSSGLLSPNTLAVTLTSGLVCLVTWLLLI